MDVMDAGVYVSKWETELPAKVRPVLWGPLQAREMGFEGWECQDGGETGMVYHRPHLRLAAGFGTATLIVVNRIKRAFLTVYLGGYPADVPAAQRRAETQATVAAAETFLGRLCRDSVVFRLEGELALVDNLDDALEASAGGRLLGGGRIRRAPTEVQEA